MPHKTTNRAKTADLVSGEAPLDSARRELGETRGVPSWDPDVAREWSTEPDEPDQEQQEIAMYVILSQTPAQKVARPVATASSNEEMIESLAHRRALLDTPTFSHGPRMRAAHAAAKAALADMNDATVLAHKYGIMVDNVDTDEWVMYHIPTKTKFFVFIMK